MFDILCYCIFVHGSNDVERRVNGIFTKIARFIYKDAEFFQCSSPLALLKKMAGNFPAHDGPGSYDQPK